MTSNLIINALQSLGYPVGRIFYKGKADTFFTFQSLLNKPERYANDESICNLQVWRVNLFSKKNYAQLLKLSIEALKQIGFTITSIDTEIYEEDTGFYHVPITIKIMEV